MVTSICYDTSQQATGDSLAICWSTALLALIDEVTAHVQDYFILSEMEAREAHHKQPEIGWQTSVRLSSLASNQFSRHDSERRTTMDSQVSESLLGTSDFPQVR